MRNRERIEFEGSSCYTKHFNYLRLGRHCGKELRHYLKSTVRALRLIFDYIFYGKANAQALL